MLGGVKAGVVVVLYDHRGTLCALLDQVKRALPGQSAQRLGLLAPGGAEQIHLLHGENHSHRTITRLSFASYSPTALQKTQVIVLCIFRK